MSNLLSAKQVASLLNTHPKTVVRYATANKLPAYFIAEKWAFDPKDVDAFIASQRRTK